MISSENQKIKPIYKLCQFIYKITMSLQLTPITYSPQLNGTGEFVDEIVTFPHEGMKCPCTKRENHFKTFKTFAKHLQSQRHDKWLKQLNNNKQTILQEKSELEETVHIQKITIARFDQDLQAMKASLDRLRLQSQQQQHTQPQDDIDIVPKRSSVPKTIRNIVWDQYIGSDIPKHKCLCCLAVTITMRDFHAGHIISQKCGGATDVKNLRPICQSCNLSMGTRNMIEFIQEHKLFI